MLQDFMTQDSENIKNHPRKHQKIRKKFSDVFRGYRGVEIKINVLKILLINSFMTEVPII